MSRLVRVLLVGVVLVALNLGSSAYAQDAETPSQQPGVSQSDPSQPQPPATPTDPGTPGNPATPGDPGTPADPGTTPSSPTATTPPSPTATTTPPPVDQPESPPVTVPRRVSVQVTPQAGGPGTVVRITAQVGQCRYHYAWFYDSKADGLTIAGGAKRIRPLRVTNGTLTASYTITNRDAPGPARFSVVCGHPDGTASSDTANFSVRGVPSAPQGGGNQSGGGAKVNHNDKRVQIPTQIDTGLGGTADRGLDPMWLLLSAGLLPIAVAVGIRLRQTTGRRQR
jgi:hypothetical protein